MLPGSLLRVYHATRYCWQTDSGWLCVRLGRPQPQADAWLRREGETCLGIISAGNPRSRRLSPAANHRREAALAFWLQARGLHFLPAEGRPMLPGWKTEPAVAVPGIPRDRLLRLARRWQQNAVVYLRIGQPPRLLVTLARVDAKWDFS